MHAAKVLYRHFLFFENTGTEMRINLYRYFFFFDITSTTFTVVIAGCPSQPVIRTNALPDRFILFPGYGFSFSSSSKSRELYFHTKKYGVCTAPNRTRMRSTPGSMLPSKSKQSKPSTWLA